MNADNFLADSMPVNQQEDEDSYNEAAAYFFHGLAMEQGNGPLFLSGHLNEINSFS